MNKQPTFRGKQQSARFAVKRQKMLNPVSNSKNFCSASPFFWFSVCKHRAFFSIHAQEALNTRLETIGHRQCARKPMPLHKRTPQGQARRLQQQIPFSDAPHNTTARIHLLFWFEKALHSPHSRHAVQQSATALSKRVPSRVHNWIPISTRLHTTLDPRIDRERASRVSNKLMKRRKRNNHRDLPIYRKCERLVRGFNQLLQEVFQIENPLFIVIT